VGVIPSMRTLGGLLLLLVVVVLLLSAQAGQRRVGHQVGAGRGQETECPAVGNGVMPASISPKMKGGSVQALR